MNALLDHTTARHKSTNKSKSSTKWLACGSASFCYFGGAFYAFIERTVDRNGERDEGETRSKDHRDLNTQHTVRHQRVYVACAWCARPVSALIINSFGHNDIITEQRAFHSVTEWAKITYSVLMSASQTVWVGQKLSSSSMKPIILTWHNTLVLLGIEPRTFCV